MTQPVWNTPSGTIGTYPSTVPIAYQLSASATTPATAITYTIISGSLPAGTALTSSGLEAGLISGVLSFVISITTSTFVIRATDNLGNINDRTFSVSVSGSAIPQFTTPAGKVATIQDSTWTQFPIEYSNPVTTNEVIISVLSGTVPPGLEINAAGLIRGYATPPVIQVNTETIATFVTATNAASGNLTCGSTAGFIVGRPIVFGGIVFGGVNANQTYYIKTIVNATTFTVSSSVDGSTTTLTSAVGYMDATLPSITYGEAINQTFNFTLIITSELGSSHPITYSIEVINQNTPVSQGGPGLPPNSRVPTIYNTRPETFNLVQHLAEFGYYVLPPNPAIQGETYTPSQFAYMGEFVSGDFFAFSILGHDFDSNILRYNFFNLPLGLTGDPDTGWITGSPTLSIDTINQYSFSVSVTKIVNGQPTNISSSVFNFSFNVSNNIQGTIIWITPADLGTINNGSVSMLGVIAKSDVPLQYRLTGGSLPPNLTLMSDGEISGVVAYQPTSTLLSEGSSTAFNFTVNAFSPQFPMVQSTLDCTLTVYQEFDHPTDILYIKCTPSIPDRQLISSLLTDTAIIPTNFLYRPLDPNFGVATDVVYEHAYGINASNLSEYIGAITINHYWRQVTLGEIKIAQAIDETTGKVIYEVVYSQVIDNLVNYNTNNIFNNSSQSVFQKPNGVSVAKSVYWPRPVPLPTGGTARVFYPNSLPNMRQQVVDVLGQQLNYKILPAWMTSQQPDGSTLGYTEAWVIAYCLPGTTTLPDGTTVSFAQYIQHQIQTNWLNAAGELNTLNTINFKIDRFSVDKSITYNYIQAQDAPQYGYWDSLPSATPPPNPTDADDFYVLFPQETILPNQSQD